MFIGLFVIVVGLVFLLDNLGWLELNFTLHLWPTALIFFGILKVLQTRTPGGAIVGGGLILVGGLLLLKAMGIIYISWQSLWPIALIVFGLSVVFKSARIGVITLHEANPLEKNFDGSGSSSTTSDDSIVNATAIMGSYTRRITTPDFRGGEITAMMGGCDLDLRQSSINGEAVLNVFAMFGGITIKIPVDWTVVLEGTPIMGGFDEKTVPPPPGVNKRLVIRGYAIMGGLEVRN
jgi:predicted membrane protein